MGREREREMYNKPTSLENSLDGSLLVAVLTIIGEKERDRWRENE